MSSTDRVSSTSVLSREVGVGPLRSTLTIWVSFVILLITLLLHIIAISLPEWLKSGSSKSGLWKYCILGACNDIGSGNDDLKVVRAFAILALIAMVVALVITLVILGPKTTGKKFHIILIAIRCVTVVFLVIAFAVFTKIGSARYYGSCFGLEIVCFILELAAVIILLIDFMVNRK